VNAVILSLMLAALSNGQVPLPPAPNLPISSGAAQPMFPPAAAEPAGNGQKPPPFRLIDSNPQPESTSLKSAPVTTCEPLPTGAVAAPYLTLVRNGPASVRAGEPFSYEIVAKNAGSVPAAQVKLEEELPPGTRFLTAQPMAVIQDDRLTWTLDSLAPGAERRFKVEVEAGGDGEWKANATLTVSVGSTMKASVIGAVQRPLIIAGPGSLPVGHPVVFQLRVTNTAEVPLTDALLRVHMTPGLQHLYGDAIEASLGDLAPGQAKELTLDAITAQTGRLSADATLLSGKKIVSTAQAVLVATEQPTLVLRQTGPLSPPVGGEYEFKLEVSNRSPAEVHDVEVSDVLPEGLQFAGGDSRAKFDAASRTVRWQVGTLAPGQARQMVFRAQVRGKGAQVNRISARATGVGEAHLHTVLRLGGER
jgi:uncharacterized repeat protein (TIGR01451 family)